MAGIRDLQADVAEFHEKFCQPVAACPRPVPKEYANFRINLITEEFDELLDAIEDQDLGKIADGIADLIYVALGTACVFGIDMEPVWDAVQQTNMAKERTPNRPPCETKPMKPQGWQGPDCDAIIKAQQRRMIALRNVLLPKRNGVER